MSGGYVKRNPLADAMQARDLRSQAATLRGLVTHIYSPDVEAEMLVEADRLDAAADALRTATAPPEKP